MLMDAYIDIFGVGCTSNFKFKHNSHSLPAYLLVDHVQFEHSYLLISLLLLLHDLPFSERFAQTNTNKNKKKQNAFLATELSGRLLLVAEYDRWRSNSSRPKFKFSMFRLVNVHKYIFNKMWSKTKHELYEAIVEAGLWVGQLLRSLSAAAISFFVPSSLSVFLSDITSFIVLKVDFMSLILTVGEGQLRESVSTQIAP